jgi:hypothetical protein
MTIRAQQALYLLGRPAPDLLHRSAFRYSFHGQCFGRERATAEEILPPNFHLLTATLVAPRLFHGPADVRLTAARTVIPQAWAIPPWAARTPFLLMDVHFQDAEWWRWARDSRNNRRRKIALRAAFARKTADELMRETLMLAWSTVALDRGTATLSLGMTLAVISTIAELDPQDVRTHCRQAQPAFTAALGRFSRILVQAPDRSERW